MESIAAPNSETPNLEQLAKSMQESFTLLRPLCKHDFSEYGSQTLHSIQHQANLFKETVYDSHKVAQGGCTLADEILDVAKYVTADNLQNESTKEYLKKMVEVAEKGEGEVRGITEEFRKGRQEFYRLVGSAGAEILKEKRNTSMAQYLALDLLEQLQKGVSTLDAFDKCLCDIINWWNAIKMDFYSLLKRSEEHAKFANIIRQTGIMGKWMAIKETYQNYDHMICLIEDRDLEFSFEMKELVRKKLPQSSPVSTNSSHVKESGDEFVDLTLHPDAPAEHSSTVPNSREGGDELEAPLNTAQAPTDPSPPDGTGHSHEVNLSLGDVSRNPTQPGSNKEFSIPSRTQTQAISNEDDKCCGCKWCIIC